jgi:hypothetical protein
MVGRVSVRSVKHTLAASVALWCISCTLFAAQEESPTTEVPTSPPVTSHKSPQPGINKLDNKSRAKALSALAGLVILGLAMVALTWLGARVTRRYMNPAPFDHQRIKSSAPPVDDWAKKPLVDNSGFED